MLFELPALSMAVAVSSILMVGDIGVGRRISPVSGKRAAGGRAGEDGESAGQILECECDSRNACGIRTRVGGGARKGSRDKNGGIETAGHR